LSNQRQDKGKSYLKYFDYSMAGIAGVYQGISPFTEVIRKDEELGMMANSKQEWIDDISFLIENEEERQNIVDLSVNNIKNYHNFNTEWRKWLEIYEEILNGR
jgi:spore maturation protein CgeB